MAGNFKFRSTCFERKLCFFLLILLLSAASLASGRTLPADEAGASPPPAAAPEAAPPSLAIIIWDLGKGEATRMTMTFARQVDHPALENRITELGKGAGWRNWNIKTWDEASGGEQQAQTSAAFNTQGIVDRAAGKFNLEPLLEAFSGEGTFRIALVVPNLPNFSGPDSFRTDRWEVQLLAREGTYEYDVLPAANRAPTPALPSAQAGKVTKIGRILLFLAILGALILVVVWLWYGMKSRALTAESGEKTDGH
jgi:hypothetical protein